MNVSFKIIFTFTFTDALIHVSSISITILILVTGMVTWLEIHSYLGFSGAQNINHHLHDSFVHTQCPHQIWVLIEHFVFHDVTAKETELVPHEQNT